ncbi:MAG: hypothetical protein K8F52_04845 [Candidatus Scalindua rubra]|uniref:Uncharacterized protein n=1 Tax=Candidatus Scalindua brodae TaxID=237368 RepID=A0A0B0EFH7_9BACT|nr:MAG: hypothetical protein SCABRO_03429 [Candidatus Scalindua brodae]MBZ0107974.1 hypothetical protein [Candidatus Scalindua rubra]TWU36456.1 hypothetical protein S225a_07350 [Candidatus Brocadiaceae bacterium S225]
MRNKGILFEEREYYDAAIVITHSLTNKTYLLNNQSVLTVIKTVPYNEDRKNTGFFLYPSGLF